MPENSIVPPAASVEGTTPPSLRELAERTDRATKVMVEFEQRGDTKSEAHDDAKAEYDDAMEELEERVTGGEIAALYAEVDALKVRDAQWQAKWAAAIDQSGANAIRAGELEAEVESLRSALREAQEAVTLLDRVEISDGHDTFDGTISGGAPCDVDLFSPGPKYTEWENAVRANRAKRRAAAGSMTP